MQAPPPPFRLNIPHTVSKHDDMVAMPKPDELEFWGDDVAQAAVLVVPPTKNEEWLEQHEVVSNES